MIVDDNRDAAETIGMLLRTAGHEVRIAYDGLEALQVGSAFVPEIVFMDLGMPNLNGYGAARRIRAQPWGQDTILIALTGWGQQKDRERTIDSGFDLHVVKPVDQLELTSALTRFAKGRMQS